VETDTDNDLKTQKLNLTRKKNVLRFKNFKKNCSKKGKIVQNFQF